jgi:signal transduction histidine kinase
LQALQTAERITENWTEEGRIYLELTTAPLVHQSGAILVVQDKTADRKIVQVGKEFIANASHELRTPITVIRGFAETLSDLPKISPAMLREITSKIVKTSDRLNKLIKSLLTLSDIENLSETRFVPTDLVALVESCKHLLLTAHAEVRCSFVSSHSSLYVEADGDLVELAVMNLLENAVRYSLAPASIDLSLEERAGKICLAVRDQGIGIPAADLPHIFGRFYTVDKARSRKSGGTGLGLSIVKTIVEKHGWKILAESEPKKGSAFMIEIARNSLSTEPMSSISS